MNRRYVIAFSAFLFSHVLYAQGHAQLWETQEFKKNKHYEGYVVDLDGDTTKGLIKFSDRVSMQEQVYFHISNANKKTDTIFQPADLMWYHFLDKTYQSINHAGSLSSNLIKGNLLIEEGCISKHVWFDKAENFTSVKKKVNETETEFMDRLFPSYEVYYNNKHREAITLDYFSLSFEKRMSIFIRENQELSTKVKERDRGYGVEDIQKIFLEYNQSCR